MRIALSLAAKGAGSVNPNPLVGAVIVHNNTVIGNGYHEHYGGPHAEINAMSNAVGSIKGATIYVTLEPCSHHGKTPPCADALINAQISKVFVAMVDPNPLVAGQGIEKLRENGIEVEVGLLETEARELNRVFIKYIETQKPYVVLKSAMSLDGKIATYTGNSKWISCEKSRQYVHTLRNELKGIMVGVNTVITDDPELITRLDNGKGRNPVRIVVDSRGRIPLAAKILQNPHDNPIIIATTAQFPERKRVFLEESGHMVLILPEANGQVDLISLMDELGKLKIDSILLEGGGTLNESALKSGIVDEVQFIIAPLLLGGRDAISPVEGIGFKTVDDGILLHQLTTRQLGNDILVVAKVKVNNVQPSKE
ncbi:MAG: bifunctional diaminohydroxyphosphoribosylaminopyrimidine deaminase/5-amino-6-(5-phosphoribosylamino)uracil reductase RibD [Bacteroidetes bacterium]|nr:bifunctional diaminohydroxyphosphoribosylaminopyrimidine deaminase/5-amino-6-(5-phosphoribosylamino)uracil reductase RibD [Bacteroidota bacterium]